jgi:hypothetical protein
MEVEFSSDWFLHEIFYSYVHEDGHIKASLIDYSNGRIGVPFDNNHWFYALAEGNLQSPFLELSGYQRNFRDYTQRKDGLLGSLDDSGYIGETLLYRQIQETLNDKLLYLIHGDYYGQAFINLFRSSYQDMLENPNSLEHRLLHSQEGITIEEGVMFLMKNLNRQISSHIFGAQELSGNFEEMARRIIERINVSDATKQTFREEYQQLANDFISLADSLSLNPAFTPRIGNYLNELSELWNSVVLESLIP